MISGAAQNDVVLLKNLLGALGPNSDKNDYYILSDCQPISGMDKKKSDSGSTSNSSGGSDNMGFLWALLSILIVVILIYVIYLLCTNVDISNITNNKTIATKASSDV